MNASTLGRLFLPLCCILPWLVISIPASDAQTVSVSPVCWSGGEFSSLVRYDTLMYASTPGNKYYMYDVNYNATIDSIPNVGTFTPSIKCFSIGRNGSLYALTDTVVMKLGATGWVNTGFSPPPQTWQLTVDLQGAIWTISTDYASSTSSVITRFYNTAVTNSYPISFIYPLLKNVMAADDSGAVWLAMNGLFKLTTSGITQVYSNTYASFPMVDGNNNLFFFTDSTVVVRNAAGISLYQNLPFSFYPYSLISTPALYNGQVYLFEYSPWAQNNLLYQITSSAVTADTLNYLKICSDSAFNYLNFDPLGRMWIMGFSTSNTGHLYVDDTLLVTATGGKIYRDLNQNGIFDGTDLPMPGIMVENLMTNQNVFTDLNGDYLMPLPGIIGMKWYIYPTVPAPWFLTSLPASYFISAISAPQVFNLDFGFNAPMVNPNISAFAFGAFSPPGFDSYVNCCAQNISTGFLTNIEAWFIYPTIFDTCISQVTPFSITQDTLYWVIDTLYPLATKVLPLTLPMAATIPIGTPFQMKFYIHQALDVNSSDDTLVINSKVSSSYDPNDKLVFPDRPEKTIAPDELLTYTIRFQNTGTAPAANVVLRDTLSPFLDLSTLIFTGSSHPYTHTLNAGNELVITYKNIHLPDSGASFSESMGAITYTIQPLSGLSNGTHIFNEAFICFDYNLPIKTNQTESIISIISVDDKKPSYNEVSVWPNPTTGQVWISHPEIKPGAPCKVALYDVSGRLVVSNYKSPEYSRIELDLRSVENGIYCGVLELNGIRTAFRVVKTND